MAVSALPLPSGHRCCPSPQCLHPPRLCPLTHSQPLSPPWQPRVSSLSLRIRPLWLSHLISVLLCLARCSRRKVFRVLRSGSCSSIRASSSFRPKHDPPAGTQHACPFRRRTLELFPLSVTVYGAARKLFVQIPV